MRGEQSAATRETNSARILSALSATEWRSAYEVAERAGLTDMSVRKRLSRWTIDFRWCEARRRPGRTATLYRLTRAGEARRAITDGAPLPAAEARGRASAPTLPWAWRPCQECRETFFGRHPRCLVCRTGSLVIRASPGRPEPDDWDLQDMDPDRGRTG